MSIRQLIEAIEQGDAATISVLFDKIMAEKLAEAIQERKIEIAESLFVDSEVSQFEQELEEAFEQLDELSKSTLGSYVKKASADMATRYGSEVDDRNKRDSIYRKTNDIGLPHAETEKLLAKKNLDMKSFARNNRKMASRHAGIDKAVSRLTK